MSSVTLFHAEAVEYQEGRNGGKVTTWKVYIVETYNQMRYNLLNFWANRVAGFSGHMV
jgi:hypothetical protein